MITDISYWLVLTMVVTSKQQEPPKDAAVQQLPEDVIESVDEAVAAVLPTSDRNDTTTDDGNGAKHQEKMSSPRSGVNSGFTITDDPQLVSFPITQRSYENGGTHLNNKSEQTSDYRSIQITETATVAIENISKPTDGGEKERAETNLSTSKPKSKEATDNLQRQKNTESDNADNTNIQADYPGLPPVTANKKKTEGGERGVDNRKPLDGRNGKSEEVESGINKIDTLSRNGPVETTTKVDKDSDQIQGKQADVVNSENSDTMNIMSTMGTTVSVVKTVPDVSRNNSLQTNVAKEKSNPPYTKNKDESKRGESIKNLTLVKEATEVSGSPESGTTVRTTENNIITTTEKLNSSDSNSSTKPTEQTRHKVDKEKQIRSKGPKIIKQANENYQRDSKRKSDDDDDKKSLNNMITSVQSPTGSTPSSAHIRATVKRPTQKQQARRPKSETTDAVTSPSTSNTTTAPTTFKQKVKTLLSRAVTPFAYAVCIFVGVCIVASIFITF